MQLDTAALATMGLALVAVVVTVWALFYFGSAIIEAFMDVKNKPREPMFWCHKHGHFRAGHCVPIAGTLVCPTCYLDAINLKGKKA